MEVFITKNSDFNILKNKTLVINKFDNNLNGIYTCNSTNEYGSEVFKYRLYLAGKLFPFIFILNTSESPALYSLFLYYLYYTILYYLYIIYIIILFILLIQ